MGCDVLLQGESGDRPHPPRFFAIRNTLKELSDGRGCGHWCQGRRLCKSWPPRQRLEPVFLQNSVEFLAGSLSEMIDSTHCSFQPERSPLFEITHYANLRIVSWYVGVKQSIES